MAMRIDVMIDDATSGVTGPIIDVQNNQNTEYGVVQAKCTGTATVIIEGRCGPTMDFTTIDTLSLSSDSVGTRVSLFPHMRARVSSYSSGTVRVLMAV